MSLVALNTIHLVTLLNTQQLLLNVKQSHKCSINVTPLDFVIIRSHFKLLTIIFSSFEAPVPPTLPISVNQLTWSTCCIYSGWLCGFQKLRPQLGPPRRRILCADGGHWTPRKTPVATCFCRSSWFPKCESVLAAVVSPEVLESRHRMWTQEKRNWNSRSRFTFYSGFLLHHWFNDTIKFHL